jgi:transmembrane sensor
MEKTKRDSRHIDPLKDEEKFFQWLKFKSVRMNQEHLSKDDYERLRQRIHVSLRMLRRKRTVRGPDLPAVQGQAGDVLV